MTVHLEPTTIANLSQHAEAMMSIVHNDEQWFSEVRPDKIGSYADEETSRDSLLRVLRAGTVESFMLRQDGIVAAMATRVVGFSVMNPLRSMRGEPRVLRGDQWDYVAAPDLDGEGHKAVVDAFRRHPSRATTLLATVAGREIERASGFALGMEAVGEPHALKLPYWRRVLDADYGLSKVTQPIQIYRTARQLHVPQHRRAK